MKNYSSMLEHQVEKYIRSGLTREEAIRRRESNSVASIKSKKIAEKPVAVYLYRKPCAGRALRATHAAQMSRLCFTALVTLTLAIGANAVVFSILNTFLLRPVMFLAERICTMIELAKDRSPSQSYATMWTCATGTRSFDGLTAYEMDPAGLDASGTPRARLVLRSSGNILTYSGTSRAGKVLSRQDGMDSTPVPLYRAELCILGEPFPWRRGSGGARSSDEWVFVHDSGSSTKGFRGSELFFAPTSGRRW